MNIPSSMKRKLGDSLRSVDGVDENSEKDF